MKVNKSFMDFHFLDELRSSLNIRGIDMDDIILEFALNYITDSITKSNGDYKKLPINVRQLIPETVYNYCHMTDRDLFEYENCVVGKYTDDSVDDCEKKIIIQWPESQVLRELDPDLAYCQLINDDLGLELYGSSAYLVNYEWYLENKHRL